MNYVIDCSFSSALFLPDEKSDAVRKFFLEMKNTDQLMVPQLWWYETGNVLNMSLKRKRLNHNEAVSVIDLLKKIKLVTDVESGPEYIHRLFELTQLYGISSYDAAYLELSIRMKCPLMTLDAELIVAAREIGVFK